MAESAKTRVQIPFRVAMSVIAVVWVLLATVAIWQSWHAEPPKQEKGVRFISRPEDLGEIEASPRSLVLIDAYMSANPRVGFYGHLLPAWQRLNSMKFFPTIRLFVVQHEDWAWCRTWLRSLPGGERVFDEHVSGNGWLLWMEGNRIVDADQSAMDLGESEITERTKKR